MGASIAALFGTEFGVFGAGSAAATVAGAAGTAVAGAEASKLLAGKAPSINIPPPPGAAMIDQQGAAAAASLRQRQAVAGGLNSTVTPAGAGAGGNAAFGTATSGSKGLLGQ